MSARNPGIRIPAFIIPHHHRHSSLIMDLIQLTPHTYHLRAGSNAGLVVQDGRALLVDTGLDRDAARRILKHVASLNVELVAVIVTHAHADHFGGASEVKKRTGAPVLAPAFEAAVVENPVLEPVYLFAARSRWLSYRASSSSRQVARSTACCSQDAR